MSFECARFESVGNLDAQIQHCLDLQWLGIYQVPERLPLQQFHRNEGSSMEFVDFVDRADARVVQRGCRLGFPLKTAEGLRIVGEFVGKELQRDVTTQLEVFAS